MLVMLRPVMTRTTVLDSANIPRLAGHLQTNIQMRTRDKSAFRRAYSSWLRMLECSLAIQDGARSSLNKGINGTGEISMRSDLVFAAIARVHNRYFLTASAATTTRKLHRPMTRIPDTINDALLRLSKEPRRTSSLDNEVAATLERAA